MYRIIIIPICIIFFISDTFPEFSIPKGSKEVSGGISLSLNYYKADGFVFQTMGSSSINFYISDNVFIGPDLNLKHEHGRRAMRVSVDCGFQTGMIMNLSENYGIYFGLGYSFGNEYEKVEFVTEDVTESYHNYHKIMAISGLKILLNKSFAVNVQPEYNYEIHPVLDGIYMTNTVILSLGLSGFF